MQHSKSAKIFVAGHRGLVGSAIVRKLQEQGFTNLILRTHAELDLTRQDKVEHFFETEKPELVYLAAAKVGGIHANDVMRGDFILENLKIQTNVTGAAFQHNANKLIFLGSSCIYPKFAEQPIKESSFLTGILEPTNEAYAVAKIAGLMLCKSLMIQYKRPFISLMPTNLYGPGDNYDLNNSHVLPALIRKFHEAKVKGQPTVSAWGTGSALREFLHSDDLAAAAIYSMENYNEVEHLNVGSGEEVSIRALTELVKKVIGFQGEVVWDHTKPDGTPRKLMDSSRLRNTGWKPTITLEHGIGLAYADFLKRYSNQ